MNGELDELLVKLFEGWLAQRRKSLLDRVMNIMVADTEGAIFFFNASEIDNISVIHFFEDICSIN
jgi:hypothetical protein